MQKKSKQNTIRASAQHMRQVEFRRRLVEWLPQSDRDPDRRAFSTMARLFDAADTLADATADEPSRKVALDTVLKGYRAICLGSEKANLGTRKALLIVESIEANARHALARGTVPRRAVLIGDSVIALNSPGKRADAELLSVLKSWMESERAQRSGSGSVAKWPPTFAYLKTYGLAGGIRDAGDLKDRFGQFKRGRGDSSDRPRW